MTGLVTEAMSLRKEAARGGNIRRPVSNEVRMTEQLPPRTDVKSRARSQPISNKSCGSVLGAIIIAPSLLLLCALFGAGAVVTYLAWDWESLLRLLGIAVGHTIDVPPDRFAVFREVIIASCFTGLGATIFMIWEMYINFCYGRVDEQSGQREYLRFVEVVRYLILPVTGLVLGPLALVLQRAGFILFTSRAPDQPVPLYATVALAFFLGLCYQDFLNFLKNLGRRILATEGSSQLPVIPHRTTEDQPPS